MADANEREDETQDSGIESDFDTVRRWLEDEVGPNDFSDSATINEDTGGYDFDYNLETAEGRRQVSEIMVNYIEIKVIINKIAPKELFPDFDTLKREGIMENIRLRKRKGTNAGRIIGLEFRMGRDSEYYKIIVQDNSSKKVAV